MVKRLIQHGDDYATIIDKPIIEEMGISNETLFEIQVKKKNLILTPKTETNQEEDTKESLKKVNQKYGYVLKRIGE